MINNQISNKIPSVPVNIHPIIVSKISLIDPTVNDRLLSMKDDVGIPQKKDVGIPQKKMSAYPKKRCRHTPKLTCQHTIKI